MKHKDCLSLLYGHYHHGGSARYSHRLERMIVPTGRVSIKILPCQYLGSYCIDLYNENPYIWKDSLYWDGPTFMFPWLQTAWWWWRWWVGGWVCGGSCHWLVKPGKQPIITVTSWLAQRRLKSPASWLFAQPCVQAQIKENIKAPRHWPLWGKSNGDRWSPLTKGQWRG